MRGRGIMLVVGLLVAALPAAPARAQRTSPTLEFVRHVPFDVQSAIASQRVGQYLYLTGTRAISIYDVADPLDPQLVSHVPLGYQWQNEDVSTNGKVMLVSESLPGDVLHVWDVSNPQLPLEIGRVLFAGNHTSECLHDCTWSYGSEGDIVDLRDPSAPVLAGNWMEAIGFTGGVHDVNEVRPGLALVATYDQDFLLLDTEDPLHPQIVGTGTHPEPEGYILHQVTWPRGGADRLAVASGEGGEGPILTYRARHNPGAPTTFEFIDRYTLGTTSHWLDPHPRFRDGGLVAVGWYEHGLRILRVHDDGRLEEVGHFDPSGGSLVETVPPESTWAARWVSDDVVYSIDNGRGIDILRWIGPMPEPALPPLPASPSPAAEQEPAACAGGYVPRSLPRRFDVRRGGRWVRARRLRKGTFEARAGGRRFLVVARRGRARVAGALETAGPCGPLASARLSGRRLRYTLTTQAAMTVNGATAPGAPGSHSIRLRARTARIDVPGAGSFTLGAKRG